MRHETAYKFEKSSERQATGKLRRAADFSLIALGLLAAIFVLHSARSLLAPILLAVVIGTMFGPIADRIEAFKVRPSVSAAAVVVLFIFIIAGGVVGFAVPLSGWTDELPKIWSQMQSSILSWQGAIQAIGSLQEQLKMLAGSNVEMTVQVDDGSTVVDAAYLAPTILGQILVFLASFYFFVATRHDLRILILKLCMRRRTRWQVARVFRDVEQNVSEYLLSITFINLALGMTVAFALWVAGVESPLLWGMLAGVLNYVAYIGPAIMTVILVGVGLATETQTLAILAPAAIFLLINFLEAHFVTPSVIGQKMTLNPFFVFLSLVFWIWIWGPLGGFIAVPSLLIMNAIYRQMYYVPARDRRRRIENAQ